MSNQKPQPPSPLSVGDTVTLNDHGIDVCFGSSLSGGLAAHMKTLTMRITHVDKESITAPEATYVVEVDNPDVNDLMIYDACFDKVPA